MEIPQFSKKELQDIKKRDKLKVRNKDRT